jgi:multiple sugar transport system permease protein
MAAAPAARYALGGVLLLIYVLPFAWMILGSLRHETEIFQFTYPLSWRTFVPVVWTLKNFLDILGLSPEGRSYGLDFGRALVVTGLVSAGVVFSSLVFNTLGAYFFARLEFPAKAVLMVFVIATLLIPFEAVMVPLYIVVRMMHLQDTYWALVLPWYASPFVIFALIQFFREIPRELDEAAIMDGASHLGVLRHVIVPNALPGLVTTALLEFQFIWNLFYWPLIAVGRKELQTIQVAIAQQTTQTQVYWGRIFAGSVLASLPVIILFLFLQRYYIKGIAMSGLKG